jgi:peptide/nickel transport system permease protein
MSQNICFFLEDVIAKASRLQFIWRRIIASIPILIGVVVVTFILMRLLPGDPAIYFASGPNMGPEEIEALRERLGLDKSIPEQLFIYIKDLGHGNLGASLTTGQPVASDLLERLPASIELSVVALTIAVAIALPLGIMAGIRPGSLIDHFARLISTLGVSMPTFVSGLVMIFLFCYLVNLAPDPIGRLDIFISLPPEVTNFLLIDSLLARDFEAFWAALKQLILPAVTMAAFVLAPLTRMTRASMLGVLSSDFIRTAWAMGLRQYKVYIVYGLRNAMIPVVTTMGMVFSYMLGANVLVEKVFSWPGVGSYTLNAIVASDYAPVQGFILLMATIYVLLNLLIDILYGLIDPRIQVG